MGGAVILPLRVLHLRSPLRQRSPVGGNLGPTDCPLTHLGGCHDSLTIEALRTTRGFGQRNRRRGAPTFRLRPRRWVKLGAKTPARAVPRDGARLSKASALFRQRSRHPR
jgi:hypothetical protein